MKRYRSEPAASEYEDDMGHDERRHVETDEQSECCGIRDQTGAEQIARQHEEELWQIPAPKISAQGGFSAGRPNLDGPIRNSQAHAAVALPGGNLKKFGKAKHARFG